MNKNKVVSYSGLLLILVFYFVGNICKASETENEFEKSDTLKINMYIDQLLKYINVKPDSAMFYVDSLMDLSSKSNNSFGLFKAYNARGIYYWMYGEFDSALVNYKKALEYSVLTPQFRNKALVLGNIGLLYSNMFATDSAIKYLGDCIEYSITNKVNDMVTKARFDLAKLYLNQANYIEAVKNLNMTLDSLEVSPNSRLNLLATDMLGTLYYHVEDFEQSIKYYNKAIKLDIENEQINILSGIYINIAQDYLNLKHDVDSAFYYFNKALDASNDYEKDYVELNVNIGIGNIYMNEQKYDSAFIYYSKVINSQSVNVAPSNKAAAYINIGIYYLEKKDYKNADTFLTEGLAIADSAGIINYQNIGLRNMIRLKRETNRFDEGLAYVDVYNLIRDSLEKQNTKQRLEKIKFEKYLADQEYNIRLLEKENILKARLIRNRSILLGISIFAALILLIYLINIFINRTKIKRLASELARKNEDLENVNEELNTVNEELTVQQSRLMEANKTKDKFFAIIGHDLKSPFNSLLGFLSLLTSDWDLLDDVEKKTIVNKLYNNTLGTFKLLEDLLDWGKTQRGLVTLNREVFKIRPIIDEILDVIKSQVKQKEIDLSIRVKDDFEVNTDLRLFSHIMLNLLNNAIKFTPKGGEISIVSNDENGVKKICVKDSGIGFPKDKINSVFDFDFNFNRSGTENEKSSGMGLILCSEYARIMEAKLSLESEENKGSTFCLTL